ncbi:MAG: cytochrome c, partial [Woeseiaceae bacterium]|nr:cytochrome c [Woeseiaceae bacterium]
MLAVGRIRKLSSYLLASSDYHLLLCTPPCVQILTAQVAVYWRRSTDYVRCLNTKGLVSVHLENALKFIIAIATVCVLGVLGAIGFAYSGIYDVSASSSHSGFVSWLLTATSRASVERRAAGIELPDLDDEGLKVAGVNDFASMCAGCHGAPGQEPEAAGLGLNPRPPDLAESAARMTPAELFWVTRNGIKMTGMPAWGVTHDDASIWPVVAFMTSLPALDEAGYRAMLDSAKGAGHHAEVGNNEVGAHSHDSDS